MPGRSAAIGLGMMLIALLAGACGKDNPLGPEMNADEMRLATAQGIDPARLAEAELQARNKESLLSLLVARRGVLVLERYYHGTDRSTAFNVKSVSKSYLSALTGIALREGFLTSLDQTVAGFLPEYFPAGNSEQKRQITIRHLLTMSLGLQWNEIGPVGAAWIASADWLEFTLDLPLTSTPGQVFNYNTSGTHLLAAVLARASGMSTLEFADQYLFQPAGMTIRRWDRDPRGNYFGGSEMYFTARDMLQLGNLYLNHGALEGRQVVPAEWVQESIRQQAPPMMSWFVQNYGSLGYGYLWWRTWFGEHPAFFAWGWDGQFIFVVPDLELVVVATSALRTDGDEEASLEHQRGVFRLVGDRLVPAVSPEE